MATCCSQSDRFKRRSSRTMTGRCRSWMRTWQRGNMPILLKTQIERTAKAPIPACHARVGGLCGFRSPTERVPAKHQKTGRCANVRECCRNAKSRKRTSASEFRQREKPQAAKQEKGLTLFCVRPSTSARSAGSFERSKWRFFAAVKSGMTLLLPKSRKTPVKSRTILTLL